GVGVISSVLPGIGCFCAGWGGCSYLVLGSSDNLASVAGLRPAENRRAPVLFRSRALREEDGPPSLARRQHSPSATIGSLTSAAAIGGIGPPVLSTAPLSGPMKSGSNRAPEALAVDDPTASHNTGAQGGN